MDKRCAELALVIGLSLAACSPGRVPSSPPPSVSLSDDACLDASTTPLLPRDDAIPVDKPVLAGGAVRSGDFALALWLYCDPSLSGADPNGRSFSEIQHLGFRYEWEYLGKYAEVNTATTSDVNGEQINHSGGGPTLNLGDTETTTGYWRTPNDVAVDAIFAGKPVEFAVTVMAPDPVAGAKLTVSFESSADGYVISKAGLSASDVQTK
jgi:hypothetical protein